MHVMCLLCLFSIEMLNELGKSEKQHYRKLDLTLIFLMAVKKPCPTTLIPVMILLHIAFLLLIVIIIPNE